MNTQFRINTDLYNRYLEAIKDRPQVTVVHPPRVCKTTEPPIKLDFTQWRKFIYGNPLHNTKY